MTIHRITLITSDMGDLGEAIAIRLHTQGHQVVVTRSLGNTHVTARAVEQHAQRCLLQTFAADVADYDACQRCVLDVLATVGPVDIPVNNAGIMQDITFERITLDVWRNVLATDLNSVSSITKSPYEDMIERDWGRIIDISSVDGPQGASGQMNYAAVKAGMYRFTRVLAPGCAAEGMIVNTISPGYLVARVTHDIPSDIMQERIPPQIPVGRLGQPEEVAALVASLCGEDAAYVIGANLVVNGGLHMQ